MPEQSALEKWNGASAEAVPAIQNLLVRLDDALAKKGIPKEKKWAQSNAVEDISKSFALSLVSEITADIWQLIKGHAAFDAMRDIEADALKVEDSELYTEINTLFARVRVQHERVKSFSEEYMLAMKMLLNAKKRSEDGTM